MAHTCPRCQQYCSCNGDWDDCDFGIDFSCACDCDEYDEYSEDSPYKELDYDQDAEDKSPVDSRNL